MNTILESAPIEVAKAETEVKPPTGHVIDLTGKKKYMLTAVRYIRSDKKHSYWLFQCDCGNQVVRQARCFGYIQSCGCIRNRLACQRAHNFKDWTMQRRGRLLIVDYTGFKKKGSPIWFVRCDCGAEITMTHRQIVKSRSCGCLYWESRRWKKKRVKFKRPLAATERKKILYSYTNAAKDRGLEWGLSEDVFNSMISDHCFYCGVAPRSVRNLPQGGGVLYWNGIDRVENSKGYTPDNVVTCCRVCNHAKRDMSRDEFLKWCRCVYLHTLQVSRAARRLPRCETPLDFMYEEEAA
jgi:hypothetical protein